MARIQDYTADVVSSPPDVIARVATLEEAKAQFQKSWSAWKAWAKLDEVP